MGRPIRSYSAIDYERWPARDKTLWLGGIQRGHRCKTGRAPRSLSDEYKSGIVRDTSFSLGWLAQQNQYDEGKQPAARWSPELLDAMAVDMLSSGYAARTALTRIARLKRCLNIQEPHAHLSYFDDITSEFEIQPSAIKPIIWSVTSADLMTLGLDLMDQAESRVQSTESLTSAADLYRSGLQIALISSRPWRRKTFTSLLLWEHLNKTNDTWRLSVPASLTKQRRFQSCEIRTDLAPRLERYLAFFRPVLCSKHFTGNALWVTVESTPQTANRFFNKFCRLTSEHFGQHITPHDARKIAATTIAIHNPREVHAIAGVLGHAGPLVGEQYYNLANSIAAGRKLEQTIDNIARRARRMRRL